MENKIVFGHSGDIEPQRYGVIEVRSLINELVSDRDVTIYLYFDEGKMKLLSVCSPRFDRNNVEYLD